MAKPGRAGGQRANSYYKGRIGAKSELQFFGWDLRGGRQGLLNTTVGVLFKGDIANGSCRWNLTQIGKR